MIILSHRSLLTMQTALQEACEAHEKSQDRRTNLKNAGRRDTAFNEGDRVLVDTHVLSKASQQFTSKFAPKRDGPYLIQRMLSPTTYMLSSIDQPDKPIGKNHTSALTPYKEPTAEDTSPILPIRKRGRPPGRRNGHPENLLGESSSPVQSADSDEDDPPPGLPIAQEAAIPSYTVREGRGQRKPPRKKCPCC
ncbi:uncharacterized protein LOC125502444 [Dendroctonus ponderosae]|uniref:uncharacterized protein LOC125502444 n=1 Tax=Dendroctonus ponderosae TaxID=77166 RepID=UPI00203502DE|nr:uncharacterized protein LOC125502444 [Dendroctonus ponderosae]